MADMYVSDLRFLGSLNLIPIRWDAKTRGKALALVSLCGPANHTLRL